MRLSKVLKFLGMNRRFDSNGELRVNTLKRHPIVTFEDYPYAPLGEKLMVFGEQLVKGKYLDNRK